MSASQYKSSVLLLASIRGHLDHLSDVASRAVGDADYWAKMVSPDRAEWQRALVLQEYAYRVADGLRLAVEELEACSKEVRKDQSDALAFRAHKHFNKI